MIWIKEMRVWSAMAQIEKATQGVTFSWKKQDAIFQLICGIRKLTFLNVAVSRVTTESCVVAGDACCHGLRDVRAICAIADGASTIHGASAALVCTVSPSGSYSRIT
jgi:hypothetical protein